MKFAEHLTAHITPEWRKQYINYEVCLFFINKKILKNFSPFSALIFLFREFQFVLFTIVIALVYVKNCKQIAADFIYLTYF